MTATERQQRTDAADARCGAALVRALAGSDCGGVALVAVGGYGRGELAPYSDLDVVLVHDDEVDVAEVADRIWYPLWDSGVDLDHSVRALSEVTVAAKQDVRVALGLLDARHLAGDTALTLRLRAGLLAQWRADARARLPELRELVTGRAARAGELAHASVPDLKDSAGGLRDAIVLNALVATWLVDVPHADLERCRRQLLDVRDALHEVAGRRTDRIAPELWEDLAERVGLPDGAAAQRQVRELGRRTAHIARLTWRRVDAVLARPVGGAVDRPGRAPVLEPIGHGLAVSAGEVVLERRARPETDPLLLLRAAAEAAQRGLVLAPATAARLARAGSTPPQPWPRSARDLLVRLLAAGRGLLLVWETLDETGALDDLLPEWERVRLLPHASPVHRYTVDRHLVETCVEASRLIRRVNRPDILLVAALLHDVGKGGHRDHTVAGEPVAVGVAERIGFHTDDAALVGRLVRLHLLLPEIATGRDLEDPATIDHVAGLVGDVDTLDLLAVLAEADARATSTQAWTPWRAGLVSELVARVRAELSGRVTPKGDAGADKSVRIEPGPVGRVDVRLEPSTDGGRVIVVSHDHVGLLAAIAGAFAVLRVSVRSARAWTEEEYGVSVWEVDDAHLDPAILRQRLDAILAGRLDPAARLGPGHTARLDPSVAARHDLSDDATVLEIRTDDRPGVVHLVCTALAGMDVSVRSAHVTTVGPQAVDTFYVQETAAGALTDERAAAAAHAVRRALVNPVTLDA